MTFTTAFGHSGFDQELDQPLRGERGALRRLEDVRVPSPYGHGHRPQGDHAGEVERRDRRNDAQREPVRDVVYAAGDVAHALAHQEGRHPAGELNDFDAAPHLAARVLGILAIL